MGDDGWDAERDRLLRAIEERVMTDPHGLDAAEQILRDAYEPALAAQLTTPPWLVEHLAAKRREQDAAFRAAHPWRARWREHVGGPIDRLRARLADAWSVLRHGMPTDR